MCPAPGASSASLFAPRKRPAGIVGCFHRMNVVVVRTEMIRVTLDHRFEGGDDFLGASLRSAVLMPEPPGMQVHPRFSKEGGGIEIVGKLLDHLTHGVPIVLGCLLQIGFRIGRKPLGHRLDIGRSLGDAADDKSTALCTESCACL